MILAGVFDSLLASKKRASESMLVRQRLQTNLASDCTNGSPWSGRIIDLRSMVRFIDHPWSSPPKAHHLISLTCMLRSSSPAVCAKVDRRKSKRAKLSQLSRVGYHFSIDTNIQRSRIFKIFKSITFCFSIQVGFAGCGLLSALPCLWSRRRDIERLDWRLILPESWAKAPQLQSKHGWAENSRNVLKSIESINWLFQTSMIFTPAGERFQN